MLAIKENGKIYIAKTAVLFLYNGNFDESSMTLAENLNVMKIHDDSGDIIVALEGTNFEMAVLKNIPDLVESPISKESLISYTLPKIINKFKKFGLLNDKNLNCNIIFAQNDRAFIITDAPCCNEIYSYKISSGEFKGYALGSYLAISDDDPIKRIIKIYENIDSVAYRKSFPIYITSPSFDEVLIISKTKKGYKTEKRKY